MLLQLLGEPYIGMGTHESPTSHASFESIFRSLSFRNTVTWASDISS